jgi:alpha-beta hydrolase superfamily lysophospholipase
MRFQKLCYEKRGDTSGGVRIFYRNWMADAEKGRVYLVHGFAEHCGRYRRLAEDLCARGFSLFSYDLRGHGQSGGRRAHVDSFEDYLEDTAGFTARFPVEGKPCWLLGHSLGGLIVARYLEERQPDLAGVVLSSPFLGMAVKVPLLKELGAKLLSSLLPALSMSTGLDAGVLSHDQQVVRAYREDPLVSHIATARWFTETLAAQQVVVERAIRVKLPLLVLQAGDDKLSEVETTRRFFARAAAQLKKLQIYEGFYHEIFNEVERQRPLEDLLQFLEGVKG